MNDLSSFESSIQSIDLDPHQEIKSMDEMQAEYVEYLSKSEICNFSMGKWLPSLGKRMRPLVAGELGMILADTGVGKTAVLQNIAVCAAPLKVLLFEIELPGSLMFERFISLQEKRSGFDVESHYRNGVNFSPSKSLGHISVCTRSQLDVHQIQSLIDSASLKIGERPALVLLDYIGLIGGKGSNRYERMSYIAEQLKIIAKATDTIIISSCQIHRKSDNPTGEIYLHDAKDSGSIENSSGLVLGIWRDGEKGEFMKVKICKNTKGRPGDIVTAIFNGNTLQIYEQ